MSKIIFVNGLNLQDQPKHHFSLIKIESGTDIIELAFPDVLAEDLYLQLKSVFIDHNGLYTKQQVRDHLSKLNEKAKEIVANDTRDSHDIMDAFRDLNGAFLKESSTLERK